MKKAFLACAVGVVMLCCAVFPVKASAADQESDWYLGLTAGFGAGQPLLPDEFSGMFEGSPEPTFTYDIGVNFTYYFLSFLGIHAAAGYDSLPFQIDGEADVAGSPVPVLPIGGFTATYSSFTGSLKVELHYFYFKLGPSLRYGGFFLNIDALMAIHLTSEYSFTAGTVTLPGPINIDMPEVSGTYREFRSIAAGIVIEPGYRFMLLGFSVPVSVEFRYMVTPVGETDIMGTSLPEADVYTWNLKARIGFEF